MLNEHIYSNGNAILEARFITSTCSSYPKTLPFSRRLSLHTLPSISKEMAQIDLSFGSQYSHKYDEQSSSSIPRFTYRGMIEESRFE